MGLLLMPGFSVPGWGAVLDAEKASIGGELRERYEFRDDADFDAAANDTLSFVGSRIRLHLSYQISPDLEVFLQMQDSRLFGSEASTASHEDNLDLHQGYLLIRNLGGPLAVRLGRQELVFGDSRLIGNFGWSNVGRSFDALRFIYEARRAQVDLWAAITRHYGANIAPDPMLSVSNRDKQQSAGLYLSIYGTHFTFEPYLLYLSDTGDPSGTPFTDPAAAGQKRGTGGIRIDGRGIDDLFRLTLEGAYQFGTLDGRGGAPAQDIAAYALVVRLGYTAPFPYRPALAAEYARASGDDNAADGRFETFENLFPTNHIHYGVMDYVGLRNIQAFRLSLHVEPLDRALLRLDYHYFALVEKADHWYRASGAVFRTTPSGNPEAQLGQELDLIAAVTLKERLRLELGLAHFFSGKYVKVNFPGARDESDFAYLQAGLSF